MTAQQERFLIVSVSEKRFAFPLKDIAEVMETCRTYPIPKAPAEYVGVMNSHGAPLPVLDFGSLLDGRPARQSGTTLVLDSRIASLALRVDSIEQIVSGCTAETGSDSDWLSGTYLELEKGAIPSPSLEKLIVLLEETLQSPGTASRKP
jgi:purine-binding chemotaxis protein CheW